MLVGLLIAVAVALLVTRLTRQALNRVMSQDAQVEFGSTTQ